MGEVYLVEDTRLGRKVAIKVLPAEFAGDAERLARFEREAKFLACLNHANIAAIYGLEDVANHLFAPARMVRMPLKVTENSARSGAALNRRSAKTSARWLFNPGTAVSADTKPADSTRR